MRPYKKYKLEVAGVQKWRVTIFCQKKGHFKVESIVRGNSEAYVDEFLKVQPRCHNCNEELNAHTVPA